MSAGLSLDSEHDLKTLSCIEAVLRIHWSPVPFAVDTNSLSWLTQHGLIERSPARPDWFVTSARGAAYVEAIRDLPLPVQQWVMP